ncbi:peptidase M48 Ste24p [Nitrosococcus halophilus Nc 4]|uniref:Putative beta-barrel assembly-enhancing protease n=1 Tax=Nitrosococcus halophilus (strain Nc4) TaxID=472759 RepID=D5C1I0_NITHN|nr:M48 family metalloprotease [Nitrosococcus halophilus]ADE16532.1 peptidase M48 Ste24p [Nitrosococcus halophilus Nc 4]
MRKLPVQLLSTVLWAVILLTVPTLKADEIELPEIGDHSGVALSPEQERSIGQAFMRRLRNSVTIIEDPEVATYVQSLGYRLVANSDNPGQGFTFFVIQDPTINAFAAPGGYIGIHSGLIENSQTESELAAVLAHEIAHITQRHLARAFEQRRRLSLPMTAAIVAAIILGTQSPDAGLAGLAAAQAGAAQLQINFTRSNEKEADRVGMQTLVRAGFDPFAMPAFFERLHQVSRYYGTRPPEFLSTHPVTSNRIADAMGRAETLNPHPVKDHLQFHLVRAKLQVLASDNHEQTVRQFKEALENGRYRNEAATRYGYALALVATGDSSEARRQILQLLKKDGDNLAYRLALARVEAAAGRFETAFKVYKEAQALYPNDYAVVVNYANALLQGHRPQTARDLLRRQIQSGVGTGQIYHLMAQAEGDAGNRAEAHRWLAEYHYYNGQTDMAIKQLQLASKAASNDFYERSKIEARLRQLQMEINAEEDS